MEKHFPNFLVKFSVLLSFEFKFNFNFLWGVANSIQIKLINWKGENSIPTLTRYKF